ncbi:hypothetical protein FSP39_021052 [Pinctada imbricata]|uniref:Uncharacterized protein n=1 Tax=Pinctada imbricata TaxID=66713 RepID=A0AA88YB43_PINIB|nr:hypothetical protein FSP39_021052 [Pinctada imbricata]
MSESDGNDSVGIATSGSDTCIPLKKKYFGLKYTQIQSRQKLLEKTSKRCNQVTKDTENVEIKELYQQNGDGHRFVQNGERILIEQKLPRNSCVNNNSAMAKNVRKNSWLNSARQDGSSLKLGNITVRSVVSQPQREKTKVSVTEDSDNCIIQEVESDEEVREVGLKRKNESYSSDSATSIIYMDDSIEERSKKPAKKKKKTNTPKKQSANSDVIKEDQAANQENKMSARKPVTKRKILSDSGQDGKDKKGRKRTPTKKQKIDKDVISETSSSDSEMNLGPTHRNSRVKSGLRKSGPEQGNRLGDLTKNDGENIFSQVINARGNSSESSDATILENSSDATILGSSLEGSFSIKQPLVKLPSIHLRLSDEDEGKSGPSTSTKSSSNNQTALHSRDVPSRSSSLEDEDSQPLLEPSVPVNPHLYHQDLPSISPLSRLKNNKLSLNKNKRNNSSVDSTPQKEKLHTNSHQNGDNSSRGRATQNEIVTTNKKVYSDSSSDTDLDLPLETIVKKKRTTLDNSSITSQTKTTTSESRGERNVDKMELQVEPSVEEDSAADVTTLTNLKPKGIIKNTSRSSTEMSEVIPYQASTSSKGGVVQKSTTTNHDTEGCDSVRHHDTASVNTVTDSEIGRQIKQEVDEVNVKLLKQWSGAGYTQEDDTILIDSDSDDEDLFEGFSQQTVGLSLGNEVESSQDIDHSQELQELLDLSDTEIDDQLYMKEIKQEPSPEKTSGEEDGNVEDDDDPELFSSDESMYSLEEDERYGYDVATQVSPDFVRANGGDEFIGDSPTLDCQDPFSDDDELENYGFDTVAQTAGVDPYFSATQVMGGQSSADDPYNMATQADGVRATSPFSADTQVEIDIKPEYLAATQRDVDVSGVKRHGKKGSDVIDLTEDDDTGSMSSSEHDNTDSNDVRKSKEELLEKDTSTYRCPVCDEDVECNNLIEMEEHIDICLNISTIKEIEEKEEIPVIRKSNRRSSPRVQETFIGDSAEKDTDVKKNKSPSCRVQDTTIGDSAIRSEKNTDVKRNKSPSHKVKETTKGESAISSEEDTEDFYGAQTQAIPCHKENTDQTNTDDPYMAQTQVDDMYRDLSDDSDDDINDKYLAATQIDADVLSKSVKSNSRMRKDSEEDADIDLYGAMTQVDGDRVMSPDQDDPYITETVEDTGLGTLGDDDLYSAQTQVDVDMISHSSEDENQEESVVDKQQDHTQDKPNDAKRDQRIGANRTPSRPELVGQSSSLIRIRQLSNSGRKPILVSPQKLKSLSEKRQEFKQQKEKEKSSDAEKSTGLDKSKFYSSKNLFEKFSSDAGSSRPNIDEKKRQNSGGWMSKSEAQQKRKRHKSKDVVDDSTALKRAMMNAKCQLNDRKFHTALHPEPVIRRSVSSTSTSSQSEDVRPPKLEEIMKLGLPVLEYENKDQREDNSSALIQESTNSEVSASQKNKEAHSKSSVQSSGKNDGLKKDSMSKKSSNHGKESASKNHVKDKSVEKEPKDKNKEGERKRSIESKESSSSDKKEKKDKRSENKDSSKQEIVKGDSKEKEKRTSSGEKLSRSTDREKSKKDSKHGQDHRSDKSADRRDSKEYDKDSKRCKENKKDSERNKENNKDSERNKENNKDSKRHKENDKDSVERHKENDKDSQRNKENDKDSKRHKEPNKDSDRHKDCRKDDKHSSHHSSSSHRHSSKHRHHKDHKSSSHRHRHGSGDSKKEKTTSSSDDGKVEGNVSSSHKAEGIEKEQSNNVKTKESLPSSVDRSAGVIKHKEVAIDLNHNSEASTSDKVVSCDNSLVSDNSLVTTKVSGEKESNSNELSNASVSDRETFSSKLQNAKVDVFVSSQECSKDVHNDVETVEIEPQSEVSESERKRHYEKFIIKKKSSLKGILKDPTKPSEKEKRNVTFKSVDKPTAQERTQRYIRNLTEKGPLQPQRRSSINIPTTMSETNTTLKSQRGVPGPSGSSMGRQTNVPVTERPNLMEKLPLGSNAVPTQAKLQQLQQKAMKAHAGNKSKPKSKIKVLYTERVKSSEKLRRLKFYGVLKKKDADELRSMDVMSDGGLVIMHMWGQHQQNSNGPILRPEQQKPTYSLQLCMVERVNYYTRDSDKMQTLNTFPLFNEEEAVKSKDFVVVLFIMKGRASYFQPLQDKFCYIEPIVSLVSTMRQLTAMTSLPNSPLCKHILDPKDMAVFGTMWNPSDVGHFQSISKYNYSQRQAIDMAGRLSVTPPSLPKIMLLQGPPGSGKSHTIVGMVDRIIQETHRQGCICLCAPSNAAIDVIVKKLMEYKKTMLRKSGKELYNLGIVRIGKPSTMLPEVKPIALNELVQANLKEDAVKQHMQNIPPSVRDDLSVKKQRIKILNDQLSVLETRGKHMQARKVMSDINKERKLLEDMERQYLPQLPKASYAQEYEMRRKVLLKADIICGTLNSFGSDSVRDIISSGIQGNKFRFTCAIIDEACQANELDCLIPLVYGITKLILVGDPEQLPPTVLSQKAEEKRFGQSLFERFYDYFKLTYTDDKSNPTLMLDIQYRMDQEIASFPSRYIYDEKLKTDSCVALRESPMKPYLLYDVEDSQENQSQISGSISNVTEAEFIVELTAYILENKWVAAHDIGIIAPYKNQKLLLLNELRRHKLKAMCNVEVGTVDGFQGREKRVIILSCVRAKSDSGSIGFMANRRRMNVALTRAKIALYIVGHLDSLKDANREWRELINDAESRNLIVNVEAQRHFKRAIQMCSSPSKTLR